ncbi:MAG: phosphopantetheine-binding protein [Candidatus Omnitrophica bacterium]|nr:phosphopantetheine-binding protein [Candidatus Omnitrophota bacterium]
MSNSNILFLEDKIKLIVAGAICVAKDKVKNDALLDRDLRADYLDMAVIQMNLEDEFGIVIPDKDIADKNKVSEIIDYIKKRTDDSVSR